MTEKDAQQAITEERRIHAADHEVFLAFNGDDEGQAFREWWAEKGAAAFAKWFPKWKAEQL